MSGSLDILPKGFNLTFIEEDELGKSVVNFLGHRRRNKFAFPILMSLYSFIFATGLTGNLCTCITIWKSRDMHTPTNFYLFSLAVSDLLLISLGLSVEMYNIYESWPWIFGEAFCVFRTVVLEIVTSASILTVLCFTVERYLAICFPIVSQKVLGNLSRALKMIMIVWFLSFLLAVPYTFTAGVFISVKTEVRNRSVEILDSRICAIRPEYWEPMLYYMAVTTFLVFVIPIFVITVLYILMGITLYKASHRPLNHNPDRKREQYVLRHRGQQHFWLRQNTASLIKSRPMRNSRRAVLKMLVAVVIAFFICWAPFHTQRITAFVTRLLDKANKNITSDAATKFQEILFFASGILYYLSATVNPVLYNIMSKRYRNSFRRTLCRWKNVPTKTSHPNGRSYVSYNRNPARFPISPYTTNPYNRTTYKASSCNHYRDNIFTFSMAKYKLVIGSRTVSRQNTQGECRRRTSFHYRLSLTERKQREDEKERMKLQLKQRKFSLSLIQQPEKHRARFIFTTKLPPLTPPNTSISDSKIFTQLQANSHNKHYQ
ncbi:unnamed protein product [Rotaria sordida]|uniref:G-protein coupled receptors family 1 profile domain-containing protein n=1 Tax=Rotaria sordida TaxID=392033 RepID=A0A814HAP6_9BILA|nr:unnamed protein product [Rotaria sordida]CAF1058337.1 unnamed protein product [Rotaria sordida]CAF3796552.1 unnamed protein product [Rotaria sordida]